MQLIGMLDSPYVRRTAISLALMEIEFEHRPLSVFSTFETFKKVNPVVKAPSLICDDGTVLMDSTLVVDYAESLAEPSKSLMPLGSERLRTLRLTGLALAACEKAVQIVYEHNLRPKEKYHEPWLTRIRGQLLAAVRLLEDEVRYRAPTIGGTRLSQAGVTTAVMWRFAQMMLPEVVSASEYPTLQAFSDVAERLSVFMAYPPDGPGVPSR